MLLDSFYKEVVFVHIDMQPCAIIPTLLGSDLGVLGHLWSQNDVITHYVIVEADSHHKLLPASISDIAL